MPSCGLFSLPNELLSLLFTDWLNWNEVGRLDSAICKKAHRQNWLEILTDNCVFRSVYFDGQRNYRYLSSFDWCVKRLVKTREIVLDRQEVSDNNSTKRWLRKTACLLTTIKFGLTSAASIGSVALVCERLICLSLDSCFIDGRFWGLISNNPNLVELHMVDCIVVHCDSMEQSGLRGLRKLNFQCNSFYGESCVDLFLRQLSALQSLKLEEEYLSKFYSLLPDVCTGLVQLDLSCACHEQFDNTQFCELMGSLKTGLRCLVLPTHNKLTARELQSIGQFHAHSLRCLSVLYGSLVMGDPVFDLINSLSQLHTLHVSAVFLACLMPKQIVSPTLTHLILDYRYVAFDVFSLLAGNFTAVEKLSLLGYGDGASVVTKVSSLLAARPLIHTICVDKRETLEQFKMILPMVKIILFQDINIFTQEY